MLLRPSGLFIEGRLELGLEVLLEGEKIVEIRPHTGIPEDYVLSPAFANVHSHLEYRGMLNQIQEKEFWPWIQALIKIKIQEDMEQVRKDAILAAQENRNTGIDLIGEWSDRPVSGEAMKLAGLKGVIFQEIITLFGMDNLEKRLAEVDANLAENTKHFTGPTYLSPHAPYTVDPATLRKFRRSEKPFSLHVAETELDDQFFLGNGGPIETFHAKFNYKAQIPYSRSFEYLDDLGLVRPGAQFVHCCALNESEIERMAMARVTVAHCPRSNERLCCPIAMVREMLDMGVQVGLGLDSPASGGVIDMFEEMRAALKLSEERNRPLLPEDVWLMATEMGAETLGYPNWKIQVGESPSLIKIHAKGATTTEDVISLGSAKLVEWVDTKTLATA